MADDDYREHFIATPITVENTTTITLSECIKCMALTVDPRGHREWHLERERDWKVIWDHISRMPGGI